MWTRQEVKRKGKTAFFASYWKFVLTALIIGVVAGGAGGASSGISSATTNIGNLFTQTYSSDDLDFGDGKLHIEGNDEDSNVDINIDDGDLRIEALDENAEAHIVIEDGNISINGNQEGDNFDITTKDGVTTISGINKEGDAFNYTIDPRSIGINIDGETIDISQASMAAVAGIVVAVAIVLAFIALIGAAVTILMDIFLLNPIEYGTRKFLKKSQNGNESLATIFNGFKDGYRNIVKVMFFKDLFIFLWGLLFIIPGIVKSYEYRMVPYILSENPGMSKDEALKASSKMMYGQKWRTFVLDLSFIGWNLLSALTLGVLGIFYVNPYIHSTHAALYETLKAESNEGVVVEA